MHTDHLYTVCIQITCTQYVYRSLVLKALCRIKLLPVIHVLVNTWMLTVKPVYKLLNVSDDLKLLPVQMTGGRVST